MSAGIDEAWVEARRWAREHPQEIAAALLAAAVERGLIEGREAERLAASGWLDDFERLKGMLAQRVDRAGRNQELIALLQEGRRVLGRARELLDRNAAAVKTPVV